MAQVNRSGNAFAAAVGARTVRMKDYTKAVWQQAILLLVQSMQMPVSRGGHMPVKTGFLRSSLMASTSPIAAATMSPPAHGAFLYVPGEVERVVTDARVGEKIFLAYLAVYSRRAEFGWRDHQGYGFQRLAAQQWPSFVQQARDMVSAA